jgi:regulator of nonsense transcripts 3
MPPKIIAKNAVRQGGVLPVSGAARAASTKTPTVRLKLEVRRLPPGLALPEFEEIVGEDWKLGNGKVDWRDYRQGKIHPAGSGKAPEQSRCYLHVVSEAFVRDFERRFLEVAFHDKAGTHKNPDLKHLSPSLDYAPNQRTPLQQTKKRTDNRQGTIDQDPEFIAFLEAETQPISKAAALDSTNFERPVEKSEVKTTPLIEDLREKKANKAKAAQIKAEKAAEKDKKAQAPKSSAKDVNAGTEKDGGKISQKAEPTAKEAAKAQSKQPVAKQKQGLQEKLSSSTKSKKPPPSPKLPANNPLQSGASSGPTSPAPNRGPAGQRQRGNADGIKKMLQKDLGIKPKPAPAAEGATPSAASQTPTSSAPSSQSEQPPASAPTSKSPPTKQASASASQLEAKPLPLKAYLKHANPSQGMTEMLIQQALSQYGELSDVTIDPRKGTAIALFKQSEGLKKALEAKRVPVANGAVEVLEFRDRSGGGPANRGGYRGGRGGRGGSRGGATAQGASTASTAPTGAA